MPFDGVDFQVKRNQPDRPAPNEKVVAILIVLFAICMLVMPVSMAGLVDLVQYFRGT